MFRTEVDIVDGWREVRLGDVCVTNTDSYSKRDNWGFVNYLDTGNITANCVDEIQHIDIGKGKLPSRAKRKVKYNSIIYSTVRPNQRHYGIIKSQPENFLVSTGFAVIDVDSNNVDADFLYFLLSSDYVTEKLHAIAEQSVSAYPSIKASDIEDLEISLPPLTVQRKISSLLMSIEDKIAQNVAINKNLEEQAQMIFKAWFVDLEPHNGKTPTKWNQGILGDYVEIKRGGSPRPIQNYLTDNGLRWLKISDVTSLYSPYIIDIKEHIKEDGLKKTVHLNAGSLVLSNSATPGIPKILDVDSCIHDGWLYFPKSNLSNEFLYLLFLHIRSDLVKLGNGSVFTNLKTDILKRYPFMMPSKETLSKFDDLIIPLFQQMNNIARENKQLNELRDTLLPKLMSGEIEISNVDI